MKMLSLCGASIAAITLASGFQSQAQNKVDQPFSIIVSCNCSDSVGIGYAKALRDAIAQSPRYVEVSDTKQNNKVAMKVSVVSLSIGNDSRPSSPSTAISVVFTLDGIYLDQAVQTCGAEDSVTKGCASKTLNTLDEDIEALRQALNK